MIKLITILILFLISFSTTAVVRYNNFTGYWEGNVCANYAGWTYVPFQPVGSYCQLMLPNGIVVQGQIINQ